MIETRQSRFKRLAERRTNAVLNQLRLISNLSNQSNYSWDPKDTNKIFKAIEKEVSLVKARFAGSPERFTLAGEVKPKIKVVKRVEISEVKKPKEKVKFSRCSNCFENRTLKKYLKFWLCKRCYRRRKTIRAINKRNGTKRSFVK